MEKLTKNIFIKDYNFCKKNWSYEIKLIAKETNHLKCFIQLEKFELKLVETALKASFITNWEHSVTRNKNILLYK